MVSSKTRKTISLAISLLVVVISLTGIASAATAPTVQTLARYTPGFAGAPGKMASDAAGNLYVADFWAKGIVKLDRNGAWNGFIPTASRPTAVAVLPDSRLIVAMTTPQKYVAFYSQSGSGSSLTGEEIAQFGTPPDAYFRPNGITIDENGYIYVVDAGDLLSSTTVNVGRVRVFSSAGAHLHTFGVRTLPANISTVGGEFKQPMGIAYEKAGKHIVVADTMNARLQFFNQYVPGTGCTYVKSIGTAAGYSYGYPVIGASVLFADPVDVAFDYAGAALNRIYVAERARGEVSVVDPVSKFDLKRINGTTVTGASMKLPASLLYRAGAVGGVLYAGSAASDTGINVVALGLDNATLPPTTVDLKITSTVPATTITGQSPLAISGTVAPSVTVNCSVNGGADTPITPSSGTWNTSLALQDGYNYILCKATDGTVVTYAEASTYFTGSVTPAVTPTVLSPATGVYTSDTTVVVSGTTSAPNANVQLSNANNSAIASTISGADGAWSASIDVAEGANVITASAWKTGTAIGTDAVTVNADLTDPSVNYSFLANGSTTVTAVQNLDGIIAENNLATIEVNGSVVTTKVALPTVDNTAYTYFSVPVTLARGSNAITIKVTDLADRTVIIPITNVTLDPEKPGLTVALPADNSLVPSAGAATASGTVDATFTAVDAAGTAATLAGGNWSTAAMAVNSGFNTYQFTATGGGNTPVSEKRSINANPVYVKLAITNPPADLATNNASVILAGTVAIGNPTPTIAIDGADPVAVTSYDSGTGAFSHTVNFATEGEHTVKVSADVATTAVRTIIYDNTLPTLTIQANTQVMPALITGTIEPSAKMKAITAALKGSPVAIPISKFSFDPLVQSAGSVVWHANLAGYTYDSISFTTTDPAGNDKVMSYVKGIPTGDIDNDGTVRLSDAMACLRHVAGTEILSGSPTLKDTPRFQADVGSLVENLVAQDGEVTVVDAVLILQKAYGLMTF